MGKLLIKCTFSPRKKTAGCKNHCGTEMLLMIEEAWFCPPREQAFCLPYLVLHIEEINV